MQLQQIMYFVTIAEKGSFNKAAEVLFISQPNLSKAVLNLEKELKIKLFVRNNRGASLTEDGKKMYKYCRTLLKQVDLINSMAGKEPAKELAMASYPNITVSRLLSEFYNRYQGQNLTINLLECRMQKLIDLVARDDAELGFIMCNNAQSKELRSMLHYKNLEKTVLGMDTWYISVGPKNPFYEAAEVNIRDLLAYPIVRLHDDYFSNLTHFLEIDGVELTGFKKTIFLNDSAAIIHFLQNTDVFRFTPGLCSADYAKLGIHTIPIHNCHVQIEAAWIRRKMAILSEEAQEFIQMLEQLYQA